MIARLFHAWECRLHAVSKDRVVRPFEWGLDWIQANGHLRDAPPDKVLIDWAAHAVSDSTRFFETPDTSDYIFRPGVDGATGAVSFPSALHTRYPENNTVHALYFRAGSQEQDPAYEGAVRRAGPACPPKRLREGGRTRRGEGGRAVLVLPQWNAGRTLRTR